MHKTKLKNGLSVYVEPIKGTKTATVLVLVRAGSKYETKRTNGLSHFLEHLFFKGTENRPTPRDVAETLDRIGGEYNAFTDKERTGYYAKVDAQHLELAVDWVSDMLLRPLIQKEELEREKGVIVQELNMYYDTPTSFIGVLFEKLLYGDQPAGWDIGGTRQTVTGCTRRDLLSYLKRRYVANETFVVVAGNVQPAKTERLIKRYFTDLKRGKKATKPKVKEKQQKPGFLLHEKKTDQTHLELGVRTFDAYDKRKPVLSVMASILGGPMSSRLFMHLREQRGLAYYVSTKPQHYTDTGYLSTNAGVPNDKLVEAVEVIMVEYDRLRREPVSVEELQKAKENIKGRSRIGLESSSAVANFVGDQAMLHGKTKDLDELLKKIDKVSAKDIQTLAQEIFQNNRLNLAVIGPKGYEKQAKQKLKF